MDYRKMLLAYMTHVISCESISFIDVGSYETSPPLDQLDADETRELREIEKQARSKV